jgi:mRNA interferase YafQ
VYTPRFLPSFKKNYKKESRSGRGVDDVDAVVRLLLTGQSLAVKYKDHSLEGEWKDFRECHVRPDLLIVYQIEGAELCLARLGSHAELFE